MYGVGSAVLLFSMFVSIQSFVTNNKAKEQIATLGASTSKDEQGVSEGTGDEPSEEPISESAVLAFRPPNPEDPRYLRIPDINVFSRIKAVGTTGAGAVDTPKNIFDTGWYSGGARPGNAVGSSLILGHVSGWTGPGVFKNINKLSTGSKFEIEKGTGEKVYYEVTRTEQIPATQVDMSKILATEVAGQHDIKLMTCSGRYNAQTKSFDDRYVVYGKQVK
jgi:LPXTG-site transpeptidase (sortase) family protein